MAITDTLILPADVMLVPVEELTERAREQAQAEVGDYALTRPHSRIPARIIDAQAATLLKEFRKPSTISQAVIRYCRAHDGNPEETIEEAFPMLDRLVDAHLLVPADSAEAHKIQPSLEVGSRFADAEILACLQTLEDTEVYQVRTGGGARAALKILRPAAGPEFSRMFDREAAILQHLDGSPGPKLLGSGTLEDRRYLMIEWCSGVDCSIVAADLRRMGARKKLLALCGSILDAYAVLHSRSVVHSDIHPRNVLAAEDGAVRLIDFGVARIAGVEGEFRRAHRAGVAFYFEPEYAKAALEKQNPPYSSFAGEQYGLAALLYQLITGEYYLDFSFEKKEMLRQIVEDAPVAFGRRGSVGWDQVEALVGKALSKRPSQRFTSVAEFGARLKEVEIEESPRAAAIIEHTGPADFSAAEEMMRQVLSRIDPSAALFREGLPSAPKVSVNFGAAGIAYALYRIACVQESAARLSQADVWAARAARDIDREDAFFSTTVEITPEIVGRVSPYHSASGIHLVRGLIGRAMADVVSQQNAVLNYIAAASAAPCDNPDLTLGQAGTVLGASLLLDAVIGSSLVDSSALVTFGNEKCAALWKQVEDAGPTRKSRRIPYLGIAHGWAGIIYATLRWRQSAGFELPAALMARLEDLVELAEHVGYRARWPWTTRSQRSEQEGMYMPGWCNGSAGYVHLWTLAHRMMGKPEYLALAEKAALDAWESVGSIGNLCCGYAGGAYAMLNLYKHTGEVSWLHRAQGLSQKAAEAQVRATETAVPGLWPESLYKGEVGIAILAADLARPEFAAMPVFEEEGWR